MRLSDFILANTDAILGEWETFARGVWPSADADPAALRDHAMEILLASANDMASAQSGVEQSSKSRGTGPRRTGHGSVTTASDDHAVGRVRSGFDLQSLVAEYRALRASVIRLWRESMPDPDRRDLEDLTRFNESIDQSLTDAVRTYTDQVDRSRQLFLGILGHDLRGPLNAMTLSAELLRQTADLDADGRETVGQISASAAVMAEMIGDLLDFTATRLGAAMPLSTAPTDLGHVCRSVVAEVRSANPGADVRFRTAGDATGDWDAARLRQLSWNLIGNAVQHGPGSEPVDVSVDGDAAGTRLTVRNGGPPIPSDAIATLFDPLVRGPVGDPAKPRRAGSIGLGLYIAREVALAHGGTLVVQSSASDGTTFTLRLPPRVPAAA